MDESVRPFEDVRWPVEILDLAHANSDQFCADGVAQEALSSRDFDGLERRWRDMATMGSARQQFKY